MTKFYRQGFKDLDDEQKTGHRNTSPSNENTVGANSILKEKCYIQLIDIDGQMDVPVCAVPSTDRGNLTTPAFLYRVCQSHTAL